MKMYKRSLRTAWGTGMKPKTDDTFVLIRFFFIKIILFEILMFLGQELCDKLSHSGLNKKKIKKKI
jgi:hypothetical protein